jgi:hypothetical protein
MFILALVADASMIYGAQAQALRITQDANRSMSIGRLRSTAETENFIRGYLVTLSPNAVITTTVDQGVITSRVVMPASDLSVTKMIPGFANIRIAVSAQHVSEA